MRAFEVISEMIFILGKISVALWTSYSIWRAIKYFELDYAQGRLTRLSTVALVAYIVAAAIFFRGTSFAADILDILFWTSIALAAYFDIATMEVYRLCYVPALVAGCVSIPLCGAWHGIPDLMIFTLLQFLVFRKRQGGADCIAFCICALYITAAGGRFERYMWLMLLTYLPLGAALMLKNRFDRGKILKAEEPIIPYIAVGMFLLKCWMT